MAVFVVVVEVEAAVERRKRHGGGDGARRSVSAVVAFQRMLIVGVTAREKSTRTEVLLKSFTAGSLSRSR